MPRKQSGVENSLGVKGFQLTKGDRNHFHYYSKAGKKTVRARRTRVDF